MEAIVIYDSWSGNTKRVAEKIAEGLNCRAVFVDDREQFKDKSYDLIVIGSPVHIGPTRKIKKFLEGISLPKHCAVFCTMGVESWWGKFTSERTLNYLEEKLGSGCLGRFKSLGFHHIFRIHKDKPNEEDLKRAREFEQMLSSKI